MAPCQCHWRVDWSLQSCMALRGNDSREWDRIWKSRSANRHRAALALFGFNFILFGWWMLHFFCLSKHLKTIWNHRWRLLLWASHVALREVWSTSLWKRWKLNFHRTKESTLPPWILKKQERTKVFGLWFLRKSYGTACPALNYHKWKYYGRGNDMKWWNQNWYIDINWEWSKHA